MAELKEILEALMFVHRGVLDARTMEAVLKDDFSAEEIAGALEELGEQYAAGGAIELCEVAGGYEFGTRGDLAEWIRKMDHYEHHRHLSRPALETLAIVAYRQPVTRQEIESIRGVNVDRIVRNLTDKKLVRMLGRKDLPGKPIVYGTTGEFLEHFGLKSLSDLPSLEDFTEQELPEAAEEDAPLLPLEEGGEKVDEPERVPEGEGEGEPPPTEGAGEGEGG